MIIFCTLLSTFSLFIIHLSASDDFIKHINSNHGYFDEQDDHLLKGASSLDTEFDEIIKPAANLIRDKRNVRPTKSYELKESDGSQAGVVVFQLDKKYQDEIFKIESPNRWVTVDTSGSVKVKEPWDYEQLSKEKTIDFWVFVTRPNFDGEL